MGVTIHFEGKLKDDGSLTGALAVATKFSEERNWPVKCIDESHVTLRRVRDEQDCVYVGPVKGLEIQPHEILSPFGSNLIGTFTYRNTRRHNLPRSKFMQSWWSFFIRSNRILNS
jgi:hypothetical protein